MSTGLIVNSKERKKADVLIQKLLEKPPFSFKLDGVISSTFEWENDSKKKVCDNHDLYTIRYTPKGINLLFLMELKAYHNFPSVDWVIHIKNTGSKDSGILSEILAMDISVKCAADAETVLHYALGSDAQVYDFMPMEWCLRNGHLDTTMHNEGGRSSNRFLPFFNVQECGVGGWITSIGWTGQWKAYFGRKGENVKMQAGMEITHLKLYPGEQIRTPSILLECYSSGLDHGQNLHRRLMLQSYVPYKNGKPGLVPNVVCAWGGADAYTHHATLDIMKKYDLPFDLYWIDAGWYGSPDVVSKDTYGDEWYLQSGNWFVNTRAYPNGMREISDHAHRDGYNFLLWFEPERAVDTTEIFNEHPEWMISMGEKKTKPGTTSYIVNIGIPECREWLTKRLSQMIIDFNLDWYRQDFNIDILPFWHMMDTPDRQGITEICYIEGLYKMWDDLIAMKPGLLIDNCASGGRRIDIEMCRRSIPLWRSDHQCFPSDPIGIQSHLFGLSLWVPLSQSAASGEDLYGARSAMSIALNSTLLPLSPGSEPTEKQVTYAKRIIDEANEVRELFYGDFYPLTGASISNKAWMAYQLDRPEINKGAVMVFRRSESGIESASFELGNIESGAKYEFKNVDTGEINVYTGIELISNGFKVSISNKRESRLYFYYKLTNEHFGEAL